MNTAPSLGEDISPEQPVRVINRCRRCKTTWAFEYTGLSVYGALLRVDQDGRKHTQLGDSRCPECHVWTGVKSAIVRGTVRQNPCDLSCFHAVGSICVCARGGKNHGGAHVGSAIKAVA